MEHILLGIAVFSFWKFHYSDPKLESLRPLILAGYIIIAWIILSIALRVYTNYYSGFLHLIYYDLRFGLLFGLGLGTGMEAGDILLKPKEITIAAE